MFCARIGRAGTAAMTPRFHFRKWPREEFVFMAHKIYMKMSKERGGRGEGGENETRRRREEERKKKKEERRKKENLASRYSCIVSCFVLAFDRQWPSLFCCWLLTRHFLMGKSGVDTAFHFRTDY